jgi:hypothetical protein
MENVAAAHENRTPLAQFAGRTPEHWLKRFSNQPLDVCRDAEKLTMKRA